MRYMMCYSFSLWILLTSLMNVAAADENAPAPQMKQQELLDKTLDFAKRHQTFKDLDFKQHESEFVRLVEEGQSPQTLFIGCSDSRVIPELILQTRPGDLFVIRTAGNFVPPNHSTEIDGVGASIQYAIEVLNVKHIIVCGHSNCGAIKGLYETLDPTKFNLVKKWIRLGEPAKKMALLVASPQVPMEDLFSLTEEVSVLYQLENLLSYPFIKKRVDEGKLELHGWYFKIGTGELSYYDNQQYRFKPLATRTSSAR